MFPEVADGLKGDPTSHNVALDLYEKLGRCRGLELSKVVSDRRGSDRTLDSAHEPEGMLTGTILKDDERRVYRQPFLTGDSLKEVLWGCFCWTHLWDALAERSCTTCKTIGKLFHKPFLGDTLGRHCCQGPF